MSSNTQSSSGGIGFVSLLTIVFITLKLTGHINWSWFWVLSPIIFSTIFALSLLTLFLVIMLIVNK